MFVLICKCTDWCPSVRCALSVLLLLANMFSILGLWIAQTQKLQDLFQVLSAVLTGIIVGRILGSTRRDYAVLEGERYLLLKKLVDQDPSKKGSECEVLCCQHFDDNANNIHHLRMS